MPAKTNIMFNNIIISDQLGDEVVFRFPPAKIISLVPSQSELLSDLGLDDQVVGITKFCIHPPAWHQTKTIIGGPKNFWFEVIDEIKPDLIIGNKEENYKEGILKLKEKYPVWISDITTLEDSYNMINSVGEITGSSAQAKEIVSQIRSSFLQLKKFKPLSVLYLIWRNPWMGAGDQTFINTLLTQMGLKNCLAKRARYPELSEGEINKISPDVIFLSSEPFPFQEKHLKELEAISPSSKIILVDGEMFSWYGSRLIKAPSYFNSLKLLQI
jgi:ABC-type Fe3+-hydroxamate transport system substrate-binding protein